MVLQARGEPLTDPSATDLDARYGRARRGRRPLLLGIIAVVVLAGLVWLLWVAFVQSNPPVSSRLIGFKVDSATSATATIQVDRSKDVEASCRLQAKAADFSIVGEVTLTVPADSPRSQSLEATVTTQRDATAVVLVGCTTANAHRPR
jgi:cytoskeletal protein RodZ